MKSLLGTGLLAAILALSPPARAQLHYVDATDDVGGNTTLADGSVLAADDTTGSSTWRQRDNSTFGSNHTVFEGVEPSPMIKTTVSGLVPGLSYEIFVHFWDPQSTSEDWNVRAGFASNELQTFAREAGAVSGAAASVLASSLPYASPPTLFGPESNRENLAAYLGTTSADSAGKIAVFIDDFGASNVNFRTWYDGISYITHDGDSDGMRDLWELAHGLDPATNDATLDADSDGLANIEEFERDMDPQNPDMDGDGSPDGYELNVGTDPLDALDTPADLDADGMDDNWELRYGLDITRDDAHLDPDRDGLTNLQEFLGANGVIGGFDQTKPDEADSDGDSFGDFVEVYLGSKANDAASTPADLIAHSDFNVMPWSNQGLGAARAESHPLLPDSRHYGVIDTTQQDSGAVLSFANPNAPVSCMLDFRIDGTLDSRINITTANIHRVRTGPDMHCMLLIMPDGSIDYFNGGAWLQGPGPGTIVADHTYSVRLHYDIPADRYSITLLDRSQGDLLIPVANGLPVSTRNTSPAQTLYFSIGVEADSPTGFDLCVDNMVVARGEKTVGSSQSLFDSDLDGGSDIWELEKLRTLDLLGRPEDSDGDLMDQAWEIAMFGNEDQGALDNPDGDLAPNWEEYLYGGDPTVVDSNVGYWHLERWYDMPFNTVRELVGDREFYGPPTTLTVLQQPVVDLGIAFAGSRMRGYVRVEETADYYFWLSCRVSGDLMLSTDETPYRKERIAFLDSDSGTGNGIRSDVTNLWDVYASQMSKPIRLEAGRKYYLEVIHQNGHDPASHLRVAWARTDGARVLLPASNMSSFVGHPGDADDDSLPDDWETANGLDPQDNGYGDVARQGERGDFDGDGLTNREEFLLGTNPTLADSDGDGLSDRDESRVYGTDPTVSDATTEQLHANIAPSSVSGLNTHWTATANGVLTSSFRGRGTWNFTVDAAGFWVLQVEAMLRGSARNEEHVPVEVSIDGHTVSRTSVTFLNQQPGSLRVFTPHLAPGPHELELFINNRTARVSVEITAIKVLVPGGLDLNGNGRSDAVEARLATLSHVSDQVIVETCISPAFIEGRSRSLGIMEIRSRQEGPESVIRHKDAFWAKRIPQIKSAAEQLAASLATTPSADRTPAGDPAAVLAGPGHETWFAKIPLTPNQATVYSAFFENGALGNAGVFVWRPLNLMHTPEIELSAGSTLLMGAWDSENDNSLLDFTIGTETFQIRAKNALPWLFSETGDHTVTVFHHSSGETFTLIVHVRDAALPANMVVSELRYNRIDLPAVAPDMTLDSDGQIGFTHFQAAAAGGSQVTLMGEKPGNTRIAVRMPGNGPILDVEETTVVGVSDGLRNLSDTAVSIGDGFYKVRSPLLVTGLPPGATVRITIFAGGVTFPDGTTVKTLTAADFDENGLLYLDFLMPQERLGATCHYVEIFDAEGRNIYK
jgi:hypothetical protein